MHSSIQQLDTSTPDAQEDTRAVALRLQTAEGAALVTRAAMMATGATSALVARLLASTADDAAICATSAPGHRDSGGVVRVATFTQEEARQVAAALGRLSTTAPKVAVRARDLMARLSLQAAGGA